MRKSSGLRFFSAILLFALIFAAGRPSALADMAGWVVPWSWRESVEGLNPISAILKSSDVTETVETMDFISAEYNGYYHYTNIEFQANRSYATGVELIAPSSGTVVESWQNGLAVKSNDGDIYRLQIFSSTMNEFSIGSSISVGERVGYMNFEYRYKDDNPNPHTHLIFEYLVYSEPSSLFGVSRWSYTVGTNIMDLNPSLYKSAVTDLVADPIRMYGVESPNLDGLNVAFVWEPYSTILFDSGISNSGDADSAQAFNVKWFINGYQVEYWGHDIVPAKSDITEVSSSALRWSFDPGTYYVEFVVDCDNFILETNETNNTVGVYITVGY